MVRKSRSWRSRASRAREPKARTNRCTTARYSRGERTRRPRYPCPWSRCTRRWPNRKREKSARSRRPADGSCGSFACPARHEERKARKWTGRPSSRRRGPRRSGQDDARRNRAPGACWRRARPGRRACRRWRPHWRPRPLARQRKARRWPRAPGRVWRRRTHSRARRPGSARHGKTDSPWGGTKARSHLRRLGAQCQATWTRCAIERPPRPSLPHRELRAGKRPSCQCNYWILRNKHSNR